MNSMIFYFNAIPQNFREYDGGVEISNQRMSNLFFGNNTLINFHGKMRGNVPIHRELVDFPLILYNFYRAGTKVITFEKCSPDRKCGVYKFMISFRMGKIPITKNEKTFFRSEEIIMFQYFFVPRKNRDHLPKFGEHYHAYCDLFIHISIKNRHQLKEEFSNSIQTISKNPICDFETSEEYLNILIEKIISNNTDKKRTSTIKDDLNLIKSFKCFANH